MMEKKNLCLKFSYGYSDTGLGFTAGLFHVLYFDGYLGSQRLLETAYLYGGRARLF